ncbi:MAG: hypothetical protein JO254_09475 [Pseudolabrys sp.]|nr:hypothetical protein [Pseudolabrys sp.]
MNSDETSADKGRLLRFRHRRSDELKRDETPVEDLAKYQSPEGDDDYRTRMLTNAVAFIFVIALIGAGLWIADTMASMRKSQDCVLSGRRNCAPIETERPRW